MASDPGRGAQVRLTGDAQAAARGAASPRLLDNALVKRTLEETGIVGDGLTADGSTRAGIGATDEVLTVGGIDGGEGGVGAAIDVIARAAANLAQQTATSAASSAGAATALAGDAATKAALAAAMALINGLTAQNAALAARIAALEAGGGTAPAPVLPAITGATTATYPAGTAAGAPLGLGLSAVPSGATRTFTPSDGRLVFNGAKTDLVVGGTASTAGTIAVTITDTLAGASNSPVTKSVTVTVSAAAGTASYQNTEAGDRMTAENGDLLILETA